MPAVADEVSEQVPQFGILVFRSEPTQKNLRVRTKLVFDIPNATLACASKDIVAEVETVQRQVRCKRRFQILRTPVGLKVICGRDDSEFAPEEPFTVGAVVVL